MSMNPNPSQYVTSLKAGYAPPGGGGGGGGSVVSAQAVSTPNQNINTTTWTDVAGASLGFAQASAGQIIRLDVNLTAFVTSNGTPVEFRVVYDGVAQSARPFFFNAAFNHLTLAFSWLFTGAASAGTKTAKVQAHSFGPGVLSFSGVSGSYTGDYIELNALGF